MKTLIVLTMMVLSLMAYTFEASSASDSRKVEYTGKRFDFAEGGGTYDRFRVYMPKSQTFGMQLGQQYSFADPRTGRMVTGTYVGVDHVNGGPVPSFDVELKKGRTSEADSSGEVFGRSEKPYVGNKGQGKNPGDAKGDGPGTSDSESLGSDLSDSKGEDFNDALGDGAMNVLTAGFGGWAFEQLGQMNDQKMKEVRAQMRNEELKLQQGQSDIIHYQNRVYDIITEARALSAEPPVNLPNGTARDGYTFKTKDPGFQLELVRTRNAMLMLSPVNEVNAAVAGFIVDLTEHIDGELFKNWLPVTPEFKELLAALGDYALSYKPSVAFAKALAELYSGKDLLTQVPLSNFRKGLAALDVASIGFAHKMTGPARAAFRLYDMSRNFESGYGLTRWGLDMGKQLVHGDGPVIDLALNDSGKLVPVRPEFKKNLQEINSFARYYKGKHAVPWDLPPGKARKMIELYHSVDAENLNDSPSALLRRRIIAGDGDPKPMAEIVKKWEVRVEKMLKQPGLSVTERRELDFILRDTRGALSTDPVGRLP